MGTKPSHGRTSASAGTDPKAAVPLSTISKRGSEVRLSVGKWPSADGLLRSAFHSFWTLGLTRSEGPEPPTLGFEARSSIQLS